MPMLEVILDHLFALDEESQEMFSFLTDTTVYTPTRVPIVGSRNVQDELYRSLLIWLDDLLGYDKSKEGLLSALERVLVICESRRLKLNPKKCRLFEIEAGWCGRILTSEGVKHDPEASKGCKM
ncbi:hypothetical protein AaE_004792 [Aphanomyces astaci]|uniref:Reverse transcriptase domain-containing protein n=1 Tax=Aphanomyces astaci TaxID=112090 RepID=A0A6A5A3Z6_APHAT|nr:hypothetical protein AaE_004792 [Aphanomyces astaci]